MDPIPPPSIQLVRTTIPHKRYQTDPFATPAGWTILTVEWHAATVDVTWLAPVDGQPDR